MYYRQKGLTCQPFLFLYFVAPLSKIPLNFVRNTIVVTVAAIISLTGSAKNTANTLPFVSENKNTDYKSDNKSLGLPV